jgi:hypothetical protein
MTLCQCFIPICCKAPRMLVFSNTLYLGWIWSGSKQRRGSKEGISRAVVPAVSSWLPTAAARVPGRVRSCRICGGQSGTVAGFLRVFRFLSPLIPPTAPHSSSSGADTIGLACSGFSDRLCGLVVRVLGYRSGGPGSSLGTTRKKK